MTTAKLALARHASRTCLSCRGCSEPLSSGVPSPAAEDSSVRLDHDTFFVMLAIVAPGEQTLKKSCVVLVVIVVVC